MSWSEDALHRWVRDLLGRPRPGARSVLAGSRGHDAAVLARDGRRAVVCIDQTIEGVHVELTTPPSRTGAKAAARALSDLAATAAEPRALLLALRAPRERDEAWLRAAIRAVWRRGGELGAPLVGGDLASAPGPAALTVSALGALASAAKPPGRDRARPGQLVLATGPFGGSALGRHLRLEPRLAEGRWLHRGGATALMDVSDGLALDLFRIARASGVAIELERVPIHRDARRLARQDGRSAFEHALHDGEDHELLATVGPARARRLLAGAPGRCPGLTAIGRVRAGSGLWVPEGPGAGRALVRWRPERGGWLHGG